MKHISDLFQKYKNTLTAPQSSVVKEFVSVCKEVCGFDITEKQCSYTVSSKTMYVSVPSVLKSELLQKETIVIEVLNQRLGKNAPKHII
jgi:hypothetical protein